MHYLASMAVLMLTSTAALANFSVPEPEVLYLAVPALVAAAIWRRRNK